MKKYIGALLAAGMVFALVMGSAAALDINNVEPLQVGVTAEGAFECDPNGVDVQVGFEDHEPTNRLSSNVYVTGINPNCAGAYLLAFAFDEDDNLLAQATADVLGDTDYDFQTWTWANNGARIPWDNAFDPAAVEKVEIHLNG